MKTNTLILAGMLVAGASFAGEPIAAPSISAPMAPSLADWFVGGTVTALDDADSELYALHIGRDLGRQIAGFDAAWYAEVGYSETEGTVDSEPAELEIVPLTLNLKLERPISGPLSVYLTAGVGLAFWDLSVANAGELNDDGTSFYGQGSAGLLYNLSESFELFGGARYVYLEEGSLDDWGWELGGRINF